MPKKTRKQKLRADDRHHDFVSASPAPVTFAFKATHKSTQQTNDFHELAAIHSDLVRTILLAAIAIGIELFIYWKFFQ